MAVPARVSLITLGVVDLNRSTDFYRALGWPLSSASVFGTVSFFRTGGAVLALWGRDDLAADANVDAAATGGFRAVALAINLDTPEDVDAALQQAVAAGGHLIRSANTADWGGYSGYFARRPCGAHRRSPLKTSAFGIPMDTSGKSRTTPSGRLASTGGPSCPDPTDLGERQPKEQARRPEARRPSPHKQPF